jgi:hypothetical protein
MLSKKSSQVGLQSNWGGTELHLVGANHFEMGIHPNTNVLLRNVFDGNHGSFFRIVRR